MHFVKLIEFNNIYTYVSKWNKELNASYATTSEEVSVCILQCRIDN